MKSIKKNLITFSVVITLFSGVFWGNTMVFAAPADTTVYLTKTGDCYHAEGCSSLRKSKIETTLKNAVDKGYSPCSKCKPGTLDASAKSTDSEAVVSKTSDSKATAPNASTVETTYIANTNSKKFHKTSCAMASKISDKNKLEFNGSRDELIGQGYVPCKKCNP